MRIDLEELKRICSTQDLSLSGLLEDAGVSRNAFYSLARQRSVLPASILAIADFLRIPPADFLIDTGSLAQQGRVLAEHVDEIARAHPECDRDTIRHTLILLDEKPIERLRRALRRAGHVDIH